MTTENVPEPYVLMMEKLDEINQALNRIEMAPLSKFAKDIDSCLESIKNLNAQRILSDGDFSRPYLEKILQKNEAIKKRIQGIVAIRRNELNLVKRGRQTAKGYAVHIPNRTGGIINSSN